MFEKLLIRDVLFLDIETVSEQSSYALLEERRRILWDKKAARLDKEKSPEKMYSSAGIYAEFGKIVCISVGIPFLEGKELHFRIKSYASEDETVLLKEFSAMLQKYTISSKKKLCAHNGYEFDYPYIARRMLINNLPIPTCLNNAGKKPWEVKERLLDTMDLWRFGDYKNYTSLDLLCAVFDIPTPKDDIDGSMVADIFWKEGDLPRIVKYCQKDVLCIAQLMLKYMRKPLIKKENIVEIE